MATSSPGLQADRIEVMMRGRLPFRAREYAFRKIMRLARLVPNMVTAMRVTISRTFESVVVEMTLVTAGRPVRVQVAASTAYEGIDLAQDRLRGKLSQLRPAITRAGDGTQDAIVDMDLMDYDFQLFTDSLSGVDSVVYRDGLGGYRIKRLDGNPAPSNASVPILVDPCGAPHLSLQEAADALDAQGSMFLFFADVTSGRGNVLYRRHDGHYALVTPG